MSAAVRTDIGLGATFIGIGLIVNALIIFIIIQVRGEHQQNLEYRAQGRPPRT